MRVQPHDGEGPPSPTASDSDLITLSTGASSPTLSQTTLVDDALSDTTATSLSDQDTLNSDEDALAALNYMSTMGISSPGPATRSTSDLPRPHPDLPIWQWSQDMLALSSTPTASRAQRRQQARNAPPQQRQQLVTRDPAIPDKIAIQAMSRAPACGEDDLTPRHIKTGRLPNAYYTLPITPTNGREVLAAIPAEFLPTQPDDDAVGRPAKWSPRLWTLSRAFWRNQFPSSEADAAVTLFTTATTPLPKPEKPRLDQMQGIVLIFIPSSYSSFPFDGLYDDTTGHFWPLLDVTKKGARPPPWPNPRRAQYFAFAPCPVDPFDMGPFTSPQRGISLASHPERVERMVKVRDEMVREFVEGLEEVNLKDATLVERMGKVRIGQITLEGGQKTLGCQDCYQAFEQEETDERAIVVPCGRHHIAHSTCLEEHLTSLDIVRAWTCPVCDSEVQRRSKSSEWKTPKPKKVMSLTEELARREASREAGAWAPCRMEEGRESTWSAAAGPLPSLSAPASASASSSSSSSAPFSSHASAYVQPFPLLSPRLSSPLSSSSSRS